MPPVNSSPMYYGARGNSSKTFSGRFCANRGNQPIKLLGLAEILLFKVKLIIYVLELIPWLRSILSEICLVQVDGFHAGVSQMTSSVDG
jgi:hypothetical protein